MLFVCPVCHGKLNISGGALVCERRHTYDRSKYGYYNLLMSNKGGNHGDNREMCIARRDFLSLGYYEPLADEIASLVLDYTVPHSTLLDAGCGEGYYTDKIQRAISERDGDSLVYAFDISKEATRLAYKRNSSINLAVASSYDMPVPSASVDTLINVFSPLAKEETARVIRAGGIFIFAYPNKRHLFALKERLYDTPYENAPMDLELDGFLRVQTVRVEYTMRLASPSDVQSLFMMTPYAYRTGERARERLATLGSLECEADFLIDIYRKGK